VSVFDRTSGRDICLYGDTGLDVRDDLLLFGVR